MHGILSCEKQEIIPCELLACRRWTPREMCVLLLAKTRLCDWPLVSKIFCVSLRVQCLTVRNLAFTYV